MTTSNDPAIPLRSRSFSEASFGSAGTGISLVIPAWNEEAVLPQAIAEATAALETVLRQSDSLGDYELIIVDDGSTDRTAELALLAAATDPRVRLIRQPGNCGYGAALRAGFEAASHDFVAFTDADCQFALTDLAYMLPLADRYDLVYGYRINRKDPALRRFMSWGYNGLIRVLLGSPVRDIDCALKIFRREHLPDILPEARGFFANTEMLSRAGKLGLTVVEVGVTHRPRASGESKVSLHAVPKTLGSLLPYWWRSVQHADSPAAVLTSLSGLWPALLILMVLAAGLLFPRIGYPLVEPDEARYAEIGREMLVSGEWTLPKFNGESYYDKPPLFYWAVAASFRLFGISEAAARIVPAGAMYLTILATFLFGRRLFGTRPAFLGAVALTLSIGTVYFGRFLIIDPLLTMFVTLSLFTGLEALRGERLNRGWFLASALCCGLGVLTKGPVAVALLLPPVVAYAWLGRLSSAPNWKQWLAYLCIAGGISLPWFAAVVARDPSFAKHFFWDHNVARFFSGANHPAPAWFYLPVLFTACLPWSLLLPPLLFWLFRRSERNRALRPLPVGFLMLWAGWCLLFFSTSKGKLPPYILPSLPAVALLLGHYAEHKILRSRSAFAPHRYYLARYAAAAICWAGVGIGIAACLLNLENPLEGALEVTLWASALGGLAILWRKLPPKPSWALCAVFAACALMQTSQDLFPVWAQKRSILDNTSHLITAKLRDRQMPLAVVGDELGSIPFELGRNDIENFHGDRTKLLDDFLREHRRAFVLTKSDFKRRHLVEVLPPGSTLTEQGRAGTPNYGSLAEATLYLIEVPRAATVERPSPRSPQVTRPSLPATLQQTAAIGNALNVP